MSVFGVNTVLTEDFEDVPFYLVCTFHFRLVWAHTICQKLSLLGKEYMCVVDTSKLHQVSPCETYILKHCFLVVEVDVDTDFLVGW